MKNKTVLIIKSILILLFFLPVSSAQESFNFDVTEIEILDQGNKFIGKKNGVAKTENGVVISANYFEYDKANNILIALGDVEITDEVQEIKIYSEKITYFKNEELILTNGNSKAINNEGDIITADDFEYYKANNILVALGDVEITDKIREIKIYSEKITYFKNEELILTNGNSKAINNEGDIITADDFEYDQIQDILKAKKNVKVKNNLENKFNIFSNHITYFNKTKKFISNKNSKAINNQGDLIIADDFEYDQIEDILKAKGNVKVEDKNQDYQIFSNNLTYYKSKEIIFSRGKTKALLNKKYNIISSNVNLDRNNKIITSENFTTIEDNNSNYYELSKFKFLYENEILSGENIKVTTNYKKDKSDEFNFTNGIFNFKDDTFTAKDTKVYLHKELFKKTVNPDNKFKLNNDPRIFSVSSKGNTRKTTLKKAKFTSCEINENCPAWSIKANKIVHDKVKKEISYKDAVLNVYDVPVFYFPKFWHPDPSVNRRSGLIQPRFNNSNVLGSSISLPYFHVISDDKDLTIKPTIFDNKIYMLHNEYRQENKNSSFITDFNIVKGYKSSEANNRNSLSHIFIDYNHDLNLDSFDESKLDISFEKVNNDTYLAIFEDVLHTDKIFHNKIKNSSNAVSNIELYLEKDNYDFTTGFTGYENLSASKHDRYQYEMPYFNYNNTLFSDIKGSLNFSSSGRNNLSNTNVFKSSLNNSLNYVTSDLFDNSGFVNNFGIYFKNFNVTAKNHQNYKSSLQSELFNIYEFNSRFPLFKIENGNKNYFTPKFSFRINPSDMKNHSNKSSLLTTDNIFDINRLGVSDSYEEGRSLTIGLDFKREDIMSDDKYIELKFASIFRDKTEDRIPVSSTANRTTSNLFGSLDSSFSEFFSFNYDFSLDNDFNKLNYNSLNTEFSVDDIFSVNNIVTEFNFIEQNAEIGDTNSLGNTTTINFDNNNSFIFKTRRNRKINLTEYYDLVYEYQNDCLTAAIKYKKTYYSDKDLKPKEDLFFTITLFPLTTLDQKIDNDLYQ